MSSTLVRHMLTDSSFYTVSKLAIRAFNDIYPAIILSEFIEQEKMAQVRETLNDGWFPLNYRKISDRLKIPHNKVRTTVNDLLEMEVFSTKRIGLPSQSFFKLNTSIILDLLEKAAVGDNEKTSTTIKSINSSSTRRSGIDRVRSKKEDHKELRPDGPGAGAPIVVRPALVKRNKSLQEQAAKPTLIKRNKTLQKQVDKPVFDNENIAEIFNHFCGKKIMYSHKADPENKVFKLSQKYIARALRNHNVGVIKQAIDNYCLMLESPGFHPSINWQKETLPDFFLFSERTSQRYQNNKAEWAQGLTSWFDECVMGLPYLIKKFGNGLHDIDPHPKVTAALINRYNKIQESVSGGTKVHPTDEKYFIKGAKIIVDFYMKHKDKISWGGMVRASRDIVFFAPMMIDARFHFSQDNVTMVQPTWFSSDKVLLFLVNYLEVKGMVNKSSKQAILDNKKSRPKNDIISINQRESVLRRRAARIAEEGGD